MLYPSFAYSQDEFEKHPSNFEDTNMWGDSRERIALYVLLEFGLIRYPFLNFLSIETDLHLSSSTR